MVRNRLEREVELKRVRGKTLICVALTLTFLALAATSTPVKASAAIDHVKFYVWNPATGDNIYPGVAYPTPTYVEVWVDSPDAWDNTPGGIVGYTLSLRVDPSVVEVLGAGKYPDYDFSGMSDGFLSAFLERYGYNWLGYDTAFLTGTVDKTAGSITGTAEAILGFTTLGVGAGGGPYPLMRFIIRTQSGVDPSLYSPITLFDCYYTTVDGTKHAVEEVVSGHYNAPPVPEFPLGLGLMMMIAPAIPIVYLWRTRKKVIKK